MTNLAQRIQFAPPWWAWLINPHFLPRRALHASIAAVAPALQGRVLDIGCGAQPYRHLLGADTEYTGLEIDTPANRARGIADHFYDGGRMPYEDGAFDGVLCNQVLEHVFEASAFVDEIGRVLKPGGHLLLTVPFVWPEHEQPHDACRYTSFGLLNLLGTRFRIERHEKLTGGGGAVCALIADQINLALRRLPLPLRLGGRLMFVSPVNLAGWIWSVFSKSDPGLYLDNLVLACKPDSPGQLPDAGCLQPGGG